MTHMLRAAVARATRYIPSSVHASTAASRTGNTVSISAPRRNLHERVNTPRGDEPHRSAPAVQHVQPENLLLIRSSGNSVHVAWQMHRSVSSLFGAGVQRSRIPQWASRIVQQVHHQSSLAGAAALVDTQTDENSANIYEFPDIMRKSRANELPRVQHGVHRSFLFTPSTPSAIDKAVDSGADAIVIDMEDAIAYPLKAETRIRAASQLKRLYLDAINGRPLPLICVRVNCLDDMHELREDLRILVAELPAGAIHGLVIPKVRNVDDMREFEDLVCDAEQAAGFPEDRWLRLFPIIETAAGLNNAPAIAATTKRNAGLVLGHADLTTDLHSTPSEKTLLHPRGIVVAAARAAGIMPIDTPSFAIHDHIAMEKDCHTARSLGFDGKILVHHSTVPIAHLSFMPPMQEIKWAESVLSSFGTNAAPGRVRRGAEGLSSAGSLTQPPTAMPSAKLIDGALVGPPMLEKARTIMARARPVPLRGIHHRIPDNDELATLQVANEDDARSSSPSFHVGSGVGASSSLMPTYGLDLERIYPGQIIESPLEITLTESLKTAWQSSFFEPGRMFTSDEWDGKGAGTCAGKPNAMDNPSHVGNNNERCQL